MQMRIQNEENGAVLAPFLFCLSFRGAKPSNAPEICDFPYIEGILSVPASRPLPVIEKNSQFL